MNTSTSRSRSATAAITREAGEGTERNRQDARRRLPTTARQPDAYRYRQERRPESGARRAQQPKGLPPGPKGGRREGRGGADPRHPVSVRLGGHHDQRGRADQGGPPILKSKNFAPEREALKKVGQELRAQNEEIGEFDPVTIKQAQDIL
jgi:hypothetical protein